MFVLYDNVLKVDEGFLNNDALLFTCRIEFEPLPTLSSPPTSILSRLPFRNITNLQNHSRQDCQIIVKNVDQISVSSSVLSKHSPVFKEMFEAQKSKKKLYIDDFDVKIVQKVVDYCHYENMEIQIGEDSEKLLHFAEKYRIKGLLVLCRKHSCQNLNFEN
uniref:BTB domain-containing protein n=1 Tax=Panagrolaimus davidi TaxID=227884 RepID=A0A914QVC1_9BILA